jgi:uncharacterized protein (DUF427 family)
MATRVSKALRSGLRFEPSPKWIRAERDGRVVVDTTEAVLVWAPGETVPRYAVPASDLDGEAVPEQAVERCGDPELSGFVLLDWDAFDRWREEEEEVVGHPRDPFHRVDVRRSARHVEVSLDGVPLAVSEQPTLVFETGLPVRYYLRPEDVEMDRLVPSSKTTTCAYKGVASYWSVDLGGRVERDLAWCYPEPLPENAELAGLIAFFNERCDITVDGELQQHPRTQWS